MIEHRFGRRDTVQVPVKVALFRKGQYVASGKIENVSLHGMFVETIKTFAPHQFLEIRFSIPSPKGGVYHRLFAMVIHSSDKGVGLFLDVLNPEALAGLRALEKNTKGVQPKQELRAVGY